MIIDGLILLVVIAFILGTAISVFGGIFDALTSGSSDILTQENIDLVIIIFQIIIGVGIFALVVGGLFGIMSTGPRRRN